MGRTHRTRDPGINQVSGIATARSFAGALCRMYRFCLLGRGASRNRIDRVGARMADVPSSAERPMELGVAGNTAAPTTNPHRGGRYRTVKCLARFCGRSGFCRFRLEAVLLC